VVSNYNRIGKEITAEAERIGLDHGLPPEQLVELVMEIVDAEDRNRIKPFSVNKEITNLISDAATSLPQS